MDKAFQIFFGPSPRVRRRREEEEAPAFLKLRGAIPEGGCRQLLSAGARMTVERWAGNGGQMADVKQKKQAARKTGSRKKAAGPGGGGRGVKILREAAGKAVGENSLKITQKLLDQALDGDLKSAELLLKLADLEPDSEDAETKRRGRSVALALAAEPEWRDAEPEASVETGAGGGEQG